MMRPVRWTVTEPLDIDRLLARLEHDILPQLSDRELKAVLGWLAGSRADLASIALKKRLGPVDQDRERTARLLGQVDGLLFNGQTLCLRSAGLGQAADRDRRRFRLLLSAFHPDRMQWHADWLTPRFQAINDAYRTYKRSAGSIPASSALTPVQPTDPPRQAPAYRGIAPDAERKGLPWQAMLSWHWLGPASVGLLALLVVLPLLSWSLDAGWLASLSERRQPDGSEFEPASPSRTDLPGPESSEAVRGPSLAMILWGLRQPELRDGLPGSGDEAEVLRTSGEPLAAIDLAAVSVVEPASLAVTASEARPARACAPGQAAVLMGGWLAADAHWRTGSPETAWAGRMQPGPLAGHGLAEALENYRRSVEAGNMAQLNRNFVDKPRANLQQGQRWIQETYGRLFDASQQRRLALDVIEAYRHGDGWNVVADYRLAVRLDGCADEHEFAHRMRFHFVPDPLLLRIAAVDY